MIDVRAIPLGSQFWIDCSVCGPVAMCDDENLITGIALSHLATHGVDCVVDE